MLTSFYNAPPGIKRLVDDIVLENARYKKELRNYPREPLVCPVIVRLPEDPEEELCCVSRNISPAGICLISAFEFEMGPTALLEIHRISTGKPDSKIRAECRWSKPFGQEYWMSGWKFICLQPSTGNLSQD